MNEISLEQQFANTAAIHAFQKKVEEMSEAEIKLCLVQMYEQYCVQTNRIKKDFASHVGIPLD